MPGAADDGSPADDACADTLAAPSGASEAGGGRACDPEGATLDAPSAAPHAEPLPEAALQIGEGERYEISGEIARGGIGRILRASDRRLGRPVAIKEVLEPRPGAEARFLREALITARLQHPAIVPLYDAGRRSS